MIEISRKIVKTRKQHQCFLCLRNFKKGTNMELAVYTDENGYNIYTCLTCIEIIALIRGDLDCSDDGKQDRPNGYSPEEFLNLLELKIEENKKARRMK